MNYHRLLVQSLWCLLFSVITAHSLADCLDSPRLTGVNVAGAEFGSSQIPGRIFHDYVYPSEKELEYIANQGANIIRLPFLWERLQPQANGALNKTELSYLRQTVKYAETNGLCVLLDLHNYAKYYGEKITETLPDDTVLSQAFVNFWLAFAHEFPNADSVVFGLMNEPAFISRKEWRDVAQQTILALRAANVPNGIWVAGGNWSGVHDWFQGVELSNANLFKNLHDPLKRTVIEVHQYTDANYSGTHSATTGAGCRNADEFNSQFERIHTWAAQHQQQLFMGEFGVPQTAECLRTLTRFLELMQAKQWRGWTYWAAGSWWGDYSLALSGASHTETSQWPILKRFFYRTTQNTTSAANSSIASPPRPPEI